MCVLIMCKPGATPTRQELERGCLNNPDGFGFAIHQGKGKRIIRRRGMTAGTVIDDFLKQRAAFIDQWAMFHARITTDGGSVKANCHPFVVGGDDRLVLGHNGILPRSVFLDSPKTHSDTRSFASGFFPEVMGDRSLDNRAASILFEDFIGRGNKIAFLSARPQDEHDAYILNADQGEWEDDVWYSNYSCWDAPWYDRLIPMPSLPKFQPRQASKLTVAPLSDDACLSCGTVLDRKDKATMMCSFCNACLICGEWRCACSDGSTLEDFDDEEDEEEREELTEWADLRQRVLEEAMD